MKIIVISYAFFIIFISKINTFKKNIYNEKQIKQVTNYYESNINSNPGGDQQIISKYNKEFYNVLVKFSISFKLKL